MSSVQTSDTESEEKDVPETPSLRPRRKQVTYDERKMWDTLASQTIEKKASNRNGTHRTSTSSDLSLEDVLKKQLQSASLISTSNNVSFIFFQIFRFLYLVIFDNYI